MVQPSDPPSSRPQTANLRSQVALLLAFATLPVGVLALAQGFNTYDGLSALSRTKLAHEAIMMSDQERGAIREALGALTALQSQIDMDAPYGDAQCDRRMETYVQSKHAVSFAGIVFADGVMHCGSPLPEPLDLKGTPEYQRFIANPRQTITVYEKGAASQEPVIVVSEPIYRDGKLAGSVAVSLRSTYLSWANAPERPSNAHYAILDSEGQEAAGFGAVDWLPPREDLRDLLQSERRTAVMSTEQGQDRLYAVTPLFNDDIFAVSSWPDGKALSDITWAQYLTLLLPVLMWGLAVIVAYYAVDRFALRHVVYLDRLVSAYARSGRRLRATGVRDAPLEFAKLGGSFDRMAQEIEEREDAMRGSIAEKDALLKEVYHRVKNNLQMIVSLTNLQLRDATNDHERDGLTRLQDRIHGLAAVHQRLSEAERVDAVRIDAVLEDIARNASATRDTVPAGLTLSFDMVPHSEEADRALPLALFATEAIANAFDHGLTVGCTGRLSLSLQVCGDGEMALEVANSCPSAPSEEPEEGGLGSKLIEGFAMQLRGRVERDVRPDRYALRLVFPLMVGREGVS